MADELLIVQFPHPGSEHKSDDGAVKGWNSKTHARKFMQTSGAFRSEPAGPDTTGDMVFWGEWEAPSRIVATLDPPGWEWPRYLHAPFWTHPLSKRFLQNTDPYVFGDCFRYSNCRQNTKRGPYRTQRLANGSVILFGSGLGGEFVLDTVFVVAGSQPLSADLLPTLEGVDDAFRAVVCEVLYRHGNREARNRLYDGATPANPVGGMFSFFPCLPFEAAPLGFPRPGIRLDGVVNPRSWQGLKYTSADSLEDTAHIWDQVVEQVLRQDLILGWHADTPERIDDPNLAVGGDEGSC